MTSAQLGLFGGEAPAFDASFAKLQRHPLSDGAWIEYAPGWLSGHATLFDHLLATTRWRQGEEFMYDRKVTAPRVFGMIPDDGPGHPILREIAAALSRRYAQELARVSLALYRDGRDSVAFHGDRVARKLPEALVASVSLGNPRRLLLRPYGGGRSVGWKLGWGDLFVMGGSCQRTWQHGVPKVARADPRMAVMFRPVWRDPDDAAP